MFCPNCGSQVTDNAKFCPNCGNALAAATAAQAAPVQEPAAQPVPQPVQEAAPVQQPAPQPVWTPDPAAYQQQAYQPQQQDYQQACQQPYQPNYQQPQQAYRQDYQQAYQPTPVVAEKKRSGKKGVLIGVGCVALAALIGGGIWFLSRGRSQNKLLRAAVNSLSELKSYTENLPNLNKIGQNLEAMADGEAAHLDYENLSSYSFNFDGESDNAFESGYSLHLDVDGKAKTAQMDGTISANGVEIPIQFFANEEQLQASSSLLLDEGEVLSIPLQDLPAQWNASALSEMTEIRLPEDMDLNKLTEADSGAALEKLYGEDWTTFRDSIDTVEYEGSSPFEGGGTTYTLTWDQDALNRMDEKTEELDELMELDVDDLEDLSKIDLSDLSAKLIVAFLAEAAEHMREPLFYVENDLLVGMQFVEDGEDPTTVTVRLLGEQNPWEHLTVAIHEDFTSYTTDDTVNVTLSNANGQLRIDASYSHVDSDGEEYCYEEGPYTVIYNDADGSITIEEEGEAVEGAPEIRLVPADGGVSISAKTSMEESFYSASTEFRYTLTNRIGRIAPLSAEPTELLKLSREELEALYRRIQEKVNPFAED